MSTKLPSGEQFSYGISVKGPAQLQAVRLEGVDIEYAASVTPDFRKASLQRITLAGACAIGNPIGAKIGTEIVIQITQDATGGHDVTWGTNYDFGDVGAPPFTDDAADAVTVVRGIVVEDQGRIVCFAVRGEGTAASDQEVGAITADSVNGWSFLTGTAIPSDGSGVAANPPAMYARNNAGTWTYYGKTGAADTAWTQFDPID